MKFSFGTIDLSLLFLAFFIFIALPSEIVADVKCDPTNCVTANNCDVLMGEGRCSQPNTVCCSVLKPRARTHCKHHGGECKTKCGQQLIRKAVDCTGGTKCCVLI